MKACRLFALPRSHPLPSPDKVFTRSHPPRAVSHAPFPLKLYINFLPQSRSFFPFIFPSLGRGWCKLFQLYEYQPFGCRIARLSRGLRTSVIQCASRFSISWFVLARRRDSARNIKVHRGGFSRALTRTLIFEEREENREREKKKFKDKKGIKYFF